MNSCTVFKSPDKDEMEKIGKTGAKLLKLQEELQEIFPERSDVINQIIYAFLTKEHVLIHGIYGTAKSDLVHTTFSAITGAEIFSIALNKFMTESSIIGLPNTKKMKEEGKIVYDTDGGILNADFVELDEMLDANAPVLRTLLGILNERQFKRGRQLESANLHTAIASTNGKPDEEKERDKTLGAVLDRFIFHSVVDYLKNDDNRMKMYQKYMSGSKPSITITLEELQEIAQMVTGPCQITDVDIIKAYDDIIQQYRLVMKDKQNISDRRACKLLKIVEANAVLHGRFDVDPEDLYAIKWGLCEGGNKEQHDKFNKIAEAVITSLQKSRQQSVDALQMQILSKCETEIPGIAPNPTNDALIGYLKELAKLEKEVLKVCATVQSTKNKKALVLQAIHAKQQIVQSKIEG